MAYVNIRPHNVNRTLLLCRVLHPHPSSQQKALFDSLGSDWFLHFLQPHLHVSTLKLGLVLLTQFMSSPRQQRSFREGVLPATLIDSMEKPSALTGTLTIRILK